MLDRTAWIKQSGILSKWKNLFDFDLNTESSLQREEISAVQVNGNVMIHFILLLAGILVAMTVFAIERIIASIRS